MKPITRNQTSRSTRWHAIRLRGLAAAMLLGGLGGCVVAPVGPYYGGPPGVVYIAPTYAIPGPGYVWGHNARYGWGWHHPHRGWHRGWR